MAPLTGLGIARGLGYKATRVWKKVFGLRTLEPDKTRIIIDGPPAFLASVPAPVPVPLSSWRLGVFA